MERLYYGFQTETVNFKLKRFANRTGMFKYEPEEGEFIFKVGNECQKFDTSIPEELKQIHTGLRIGSFDPENGVFTGIVKCDSEEEFKVVITELIDTYNKNFNKNLEF